MTKELWKKIEDSVVRVLNSDFDTDIVEMCSTDNSWCKDELGIYVYRNDWDVDNKTLVFSVSCYDYRIMGFDRDCNVEYEYYYIDGVKFVDRAINALLELEKLYQLKLPLSYDEVATALLKLAEKDLNLAAEAVVHFAFMPRWYEYNDERINEALDYVYTVVEFVKKVFPYKSGELDVFLRLSDIWVKISSDVKELLSYKKTLKYYAVVYMCLLNIDCRKIGIHIYTIGDRPKFGEYVTKLSIYDVKYKLYVWGRALVNGAICGVIKYADERGVRLDKYEVTEAIYSMAKDRPRQAAELVITAALYCICHNGGGNCTIFAASQDSVKITYSLNLDPLDEFVEKTGGSEVLQNDGPPDEHAQ
ncbi:MAG: hypothetical protein ACK4SY_08210 [Pyrobaculum sp.]